MPVQELSIIIRRTDILMLEMIAQNLLMMVVVVTIIRIGKTLANIKTHINVLITDSSRVRVSLDAKIPSQGITTHRHRATIISSEEDTTSNNDNLIKVNFRTHHRTIKIDHNRVETRLVDTNSGKPNAVAPKGVAMQVNRIVEVISALTRQVPISNNSVLSATSQKKIRDHQTPVTEEATVAIKYSVQSYAI